MAPNITDMVVELGAGDQLVGVSTYCRAPRPDLPRVGGYLDPDIESVLALKPDLVLSPPNPRLEKAMAAFSVPLYVVSTQWSTVASIQESFMTLAERLGLAAQGAALRKQVEATLADVAEEASSRTPRRVLLVVARQPGSMVVAGPGTYISELIELAGGINVVGEGGHYPTLGIETVVGMAPEVIIDVSAGEGDQGAAGEARRVWSTYASLPAVRSDAIRVEPPGQLLQPGPSTGESARRLLRMIHGS
jgi:iron complex transport system substrate-binding protein